MITLKFIYSEKATKFSDISTLLLTCTTQDKSKVEISQNFVAFSEYMNFNGILKLHQKELYELFSFYAQNMLNKCLLSCLKEFDKVCSR